MTKIVALITVLFLPFSESLNHDDARWGQIGHRATGEIAEMYLTPKAAAEVKRVLGNESLAIVTTWMDEVRSDPSFNYMSPWHYVTIPEADTYETAEKAEGGDIIWALEKVISELKAGNLSAEQENINLMVLAHLVGDIHQPLHVGNGTDRGGNDVRVQWFGGNSNLHRVWDSEVIDDKQLSYTELAEAVNYTTPELVRELQSATIHDWAYESKDLLPQVYQIPDNNRLGYEYAFKNWDTMQMRILRAGVRMAGVINDIYQ